MFQRLDDLGEAVGQVGRMQGTAPRDMLQTDSPLQ